MTLANALSVSRIVLSFSAFALLTTWEWRVPFATLLLTLGALSDCADGYISRKQGTASRFGAYLDLIGDHVFIGCTSLVLLKIEQLPLWFVLIILIRTFVTMAARGYDAQQLGIPHKTRIGVTATILFYITVVVLTAQPILPLQLPFPLPEILIGVSAAFALVGLSQYVYWFVKKRSLA